MSITSVVPSSLEMARTASSTFYEVDEECVDSPFESSSSSDSNHDEVVIRDLEEEQDKGDWRRHRGMQLHVIGGLARGRAASVRTPASKPSSSGIGPAC